MTYKIIALSEAGVEQLAQQEVKELINVDAQVSGQVLDFSVSDFKQLLKYVYRTQAAKRVGLFLAKVPKIEMLDISALDFAWKNYFSSELNFKVEVLGVKGHKNRLAISKHVVGQVFKVFDTIGISPQIELRKPQLIIFVYFDGENYNLALDVCGVELTSRHYRLFTNSASFKGDLAYYFVRKVGFSDGKLLVGFVKDGTLAIEAVLHTNELPVLSKKVSRYSFGKFPLLCEFDFIGFRSGFSGQDKKVFAFDSSRQNVTAANKNALLAGVKNNVEVIKCMLDELDVKYEEGQFDNFTLQLTQKDEDKLNEIYYQASYVLKQGGKLLLIGRQKFAPTVSGKFKLVSEEEFDKGGNVHKVVVLQKL